MYEGGYQLPPRPFVAAPDDTSILPLAPELVVPDKNDNDPLIPVVPASTDLIIINPELFLMPEPVVIDKEPPLAHIV